jgi:REP element-mobilizing transposase RayT
VSLRNRGLEPAVSTCPVPPPTGRERLRRSEATDMAIEQETRFWLVTFPTKGTRASRADVLFRARSAAVVLLDDEEQAAIVRHLRDACHTHCAQVLALAVLPDHVHMVVAASGEAELTTAIGRVKGASARAFNQERGADEGGAIWARGFHRRELADADALGAAITYVRGHRARHAERWR